MPTGTNPTIMYNTLAMLDDTIDVEILPEDKVQLSNDQKNLIELAFAKQLPPEDAEFMEKIQIDSTTGADPLEEISTYYTAKYGGDFGIIYFAAVTRGEEGYKEILRSVEKSNALERIEKEKKN